MKKCLPEEARSGKCANVESGTVFCTANLVACSDGGMGDEPSAQLW
jgi:hypothetical protein